MAETFASGWENPDHHEPASARPRPMFDEQGNPVTEAPPAQPEPEMDEIMRQPVHVQPRAVPWNAPEMGHPELLDRLDEILRPGDIQPSEGRMVSVPMSYLSESSFKRQLLAIVEPALDNPSPAGWAVALEKVRELCS